MFFLPRSFSIVVFLVSPDISAPKINNQYTCAHTHTHTEAHLTNTATIIYWSYYSHGLPSDPECCLSPKEQNPPQNSGQTQRRAQKSSEVLPLSLVLLLPYCSLNISSYISFFLFFLILDGLTSYLQKNAIHNRKDN